MIAPTHRFRIYRTRAAREYLCVCAASDKRHALKVARQTFRLQRDAFALPEFSPVVSPSLKRDGTLAEHAGSQKS